MAKRRKSSTAKVAAGGILNPTVIGRMVPGSPAEYYQLLPKQSPMQIRSLLWTAMQGNWSSWYDLNSLMQDSWPRLAKNLHEVREAVKGTRMTVQPFAQRDQDPTASAKEKADMAQDAIDAFAPIPGSDEMGFSDMVYELCGALVMPNIQEILWHQTDQAVWAPRATVGVNPRSFGFTESGQLGLRFDPDPADPYNRGAAGDLPDNKFLVSIYKTRSGAMTMSGLLRPLAFWWGAMTMGRDWLLRYAELFGQPLRTAFYDINVGEGVIAQINAMLAGMGASAWGSFPHGTEFKFEEFKGAGTDNPQRFFIEQGDKYADLMILGETQTGDAGEHGGNKALGQVHHKIRQQRIEAIAAWCAELLTYQFIRPIMLLNYGTLDECPYMSPDFSEPQSPKEMSDVILTLQQAGWQADEVEMNERFNMKLTRTTPAQPKGSAPGGGQDQPDQPLLARATALNAPTSTVDPLTAAAAKDFAPLIKRIDALADVKDPAELKREIAKLQKILAKAAPDNKHMAAALEEAMATALLKGAGEEKKLEPKAKK